MMAAAVVLGLGAGYVVAQSQVPRFSTQALIQVGEPQRQQAGVTAIETGVRFSPASWANLMRSNRVLERVVDDLNLFVWAQPPATPDAFLHAAVVGTIRRGGYIVRVDEAGRTVSLLDEEERVLESHELASLLPVSSEDSLGDPETEDGTGEDPVMLGESVGVNLNLAPAALEPGAELRFTLQPRRDAARNLAQGLMVQPSQSAFMVVGMQGQDPWWIAQIVNAVTESFLAEATELARAQSDELSQTLQEQLATTQRALSQAEAELEAFESAMASNVELSAQWSGSDPAAASGLVDLRTELDQLSRDRENLTRTLGEAERAGTLRVQALEAIPSVRESSELMGVLEQITERRAEVRSLLVRYTEDHPSVLEGRAELRELEQEAIPALADELLAELDVRVSDLQARADARSDDLRAIPGQALTRARLRREVSQAEALFEDVNRRYAAARLAALSTAPDLQIVDRAEPPSRADGDRRLMMALVTLFGFVGAGGLGAILMDLRDKRVRSPSDVETGLGLPILGALPHLATRGGRVRAKDQNQAVEAFRSIRLGLTYAYGTASPMVLTISSPAPGDGKSFTTSNLGLSFAELGRRTVVVDGDVRKGTQHTHLGVDRTPGLTDYLTGEVELDDILQGTRHPALSVIPYGSVVQNAPEFMVSGRMQDLLARLKADFDVILVDSPPLGAASDPLILGTLTGSMLLVLRNGATNTDQAAAILQNLHRYPIRVVGAVLNDVPSRGEYRYYGYTSGYEVGAGARADKKDRKGSRLVGAGR
ncbi:MAG: polysaccharide biosynthesis tyrosine autokinase [Gemmatimonadales bacterium]|nr:MAG: polysaccharide biosynthesis tyrosine autokinase [Gemmatimonadales bacterium]